MTRVLCKAVTSYCVSHSPLTLHDTKVQHADDLVQTGKGTTARWCRESDLNEWS